MSVIFYISLFKKIIIAIIEVMKKIRSLPAVISICMLGIIVNITHSFAYNSLTSGAISRVVLDWVFLAAGGVTLWGYYRVRSVELFTLFLAYVLRSMSGGLFIVFDVATLTSFPVEFIIRVGLFNLLSSFGLFGILVLFFEDSPLFQRGLFTLSVPVLALFIALVEPINTYRSGVGIFPVYFHDSIPITILLVLILTVGMLGMVKAVVTHSSSRYQFLLLFYVIQGVFWFVTLFNFPLWVHMFFIMGLISSLVFFILEMEKLYQQ